MPHRRTLLLPAALLALWHLVFICAGFLAPYDPAEQDRDLPYTAPAHWQFHDSQGFHLRPYVCPPHDLAATSQPQQCYPLQFFVHGWRYSFAGMRWSVHLFGVPTPGRIAILGTDAYGRDMCSRLLFGGRISLAIGLLAVLVSLLAAMLIGTVSGYYGKWTDELLMGGAELFLVVPWLYFLLALRAMLPLHLSASATFLLVVGVIGSLGWARPMRLIRGLVLSARERNYVLAARGFALIRGRDYVIPEDVKAVAVPALAHRLVEVVGSLKLEGMSVILSESDLQHSERMVDRIFVIDRGSVVTRA